MHSITANFRTIIWQAIFGTMLITCLSNLLLAQETEFIIGNNVALSKRPFTTEEELVISISSIKSGEEIWLQRCGNERCSVGSPVAKWKFGNLSRLNKSTVSTFGDRYGFYLYNFSNGNKDIMAVSTEYKDGATTIIFESGTTLAVKIQNAH